MIKFFIFLLFLICVGCNQSNKSETTEDTHAGSTIKSQKLKDSASVIDSLKTFNSPSGYSKSNSELIKKESLFETLKKIDCAYDHLPSELILSLDSINSYKELPTDENLSQLLSFSSCYLKFKPSDHLNAYLLFADMNESHYSANISLIMVDSISDHMEQIWLAVAYGNESIDYEIESKLISSSSLERITNHNIRYIHGVGEVDSIYQLKELFDSLYQGVITPTHVTIEESKRRNTILERI